MCERKFYLMRIQLLECLEQDIVQNWAKVALQSERPNDLTLRHDYDLATHAAKQLQHAFTNEEDMPSPMKRMLLHHRHAEVQNATKWLASKRKIMKYDEKHHIDRYVEDGLREYKAWKLFKKPDTIQKCLINMTTSFVEDGMSPEEARQKAERGMDFIDSSEDETHPTFALRQKMPAWRAVFASQDGPTSCHISPLVATDVPCDEHMMDGGLQGATAVLEGRKPPYDVPIVMVPHTQIQSAWSLFFYQCCQFLLRGTWLFSAREGQAFHCTLSHSHAVKTSILAIRIPTKAAFKDEQERFGESF